MSAPELEFGSGLPRYRIIKKIGAGSGGVVFRAYDEELHRDVALKFLYADDEKSRKKLLHEAQIAASLNHPNICTIYEVGQHSEQTYLAMEHVAGQSLAHHLEDGPLPMETVVNYGMQMADALAYAHDHGVIHRDLKSSNVALTPELRPKILDFGLARRQGTQRPDGDTRTLTREPAIEGTLSYAAPEVLRRLMPDSRSDIWSLGVVLYEMATGTLPFVGATAPEICSAILRDAVDLGPIRSAALAAIIGRSLSKDPAQRYQHAREIHAALQALATQGAGTSDPRQQQTETNRTTRTGISVWKAAIVLSLVLAAAAVTAFFLRPTPKTGHFDSIAVLPLTNLSGDAEQDYLVDGMTDILIINLAKIRAFKRVISRDSVLKYRNRGDKVSLRDAAHELNVDVILTGTVLQQHDSVRITLQLIDPNADRLLWAQDYEGSLSNALGLEGRIAIEVAQQVKLSLTPQERQNLTRHSTENSTASIAYLKGRYYWNKRDAADLEKAREYFQQAIDTDPGYALAYAGLADYYSVLTTNQGAHKSAEAREAANKALELDPTLAEPHAALGLMALTDGYNLGAAEAELRRSVALNPNYASAHQWYAIVLTFSGRVVEALAEARRAQELDPLSMTINSYLGYCLYLNRQYLEAQSQFQKTLELDRDFAIAHYFYARLLVAEGKPLEAVTHAERAAALSPEIPAMKATLAYAYAASGRDERARQILGALEGDTNAAKSAEASFAFARLHEPALAIKALEDAAMSGMLWSVSMPSEPALDSIRSDPRFAKLWTMVNRH